MKFLYNSPLFISASSLGKICEQSTVIKGSICLQPRCWLPEEINRPVQAKDIQVRRGPETFSLVLGKLYVYPSPGKHAKKKVKVDKIACSVFCSAQLCLEMGLVQNCLVNFCPNSHLKHSQLQIMVLSSHRIFTPSSEPEQSVHNQVQFM